MTQGIKPPEECKFLRKKLGSRFDKVVKAYHATDISGHKKENKKGAGRKPASIINPYWWYFNHLEYGKQWRQMTTDIQNVIAGICRLDHYSQTHRERPLSVMKCVFILENETITTNTVEIHAGVSKRQAQRYMKACKLIIMFLDKPIEDFLEHKRISYTKKILGDCEEWGIEPTEEYIEQALESMFCVNFSKDGVAMEDDFN